jgi:hypothetical protein
VGGGGFVVCVWLFGGLLALSLCFWGFLALFCLAMINLLAFVISCL